MFSQYFKTLDFMLSSRPLDRVIHNCTEPIELHTILYPIHLLTAGCGCLLLSGNVSVCCCHLVVTDCCELEWRKSGGGLLAGGVASSATSNGTSTGISIQLALFIYETPAALSKCLVRGDESRRNGTGLGLAAAAAARNAM